MIKCINRHFSLCISTGTSSQCRHRVCRGRATGGDVLWKAQHARQHSDRPLGTGPIRNQELRRNQRGCAAVLPGGESLWQRHMARQISYQSHWSAWLDRDLVICISSLVYIKFFWFKYNSVMLSGIKSSGLFDVNCICAAIKAQCSTEIVINVIYWEWT